MAVPAPRADGDPVSDVRDHARDAPGAARRLRGGDADAPAVVRGGAGVRRAGDGGDDRVPGAEGSWGTAIERRGVLWGWGARGRARDHLGCTPGGVTLRSFVVDRRRLPPWTAAISLVDRCRLSLSSVETPLSSVKTPGRSVETPGRSVVVRPRPVVARPERPSDDPTEASGHSTEAGGRLTEASGKTTVGLDVEAEVDDVPVPHHVLLAFDRELPRVAAFRFAAELHVVLPPDDLGLDEALLEVGVDDAGRLRRSRPLDRRPGADLDLAGGEECLQPEELVPSADDRVEARLASGPARSRESGRSAGSSSAICASSATARTRGRSARPSLTACFFSAA